MNETRRTLIFVGAAVAMLLLAWLAWATLPSFAPEEELGQKLLPELGGATAAARVTITRYDEASRSPSELTLVRQGGQWKVPVPRTPPAPLPEPPLLHPVDAPGRMQRLFAALADPEILAVLSDNRGDREKFGVEDPAAAETQQEARSGVGIRITVQGIAGQTLADVVVSRKTADELRADVRASADRSSSAPLRYARRADQDRIYTVGFDAELLSTDLLDWIDRDLLAIEPARLKRITISEHAVLRVEHQVEQRTALIPKRFPRRELVLEHLPGDEQASWKLLARREFAPDGTPTSIPLGQRERLNTHALEHLSEALAQLRVAGVGGKPIGVSGDLTLTDEFYRDEGIHAQPVFNALEQQGFVMHAVFADEDAATDKIKAFALTSITSVVRCLRDDGVEVVMHFGSLNPAAQFADHLALDVSFSAALGGPVAAAATLVSLAGQSGPAFLDMQDNPPRAGGLRRERVVYATAFPQDPANERQAAAAAALQSRLAPWYYVVSDEAYRAIFLPQDRVVLAEPDTPPGHPEDGSHEDPDARHEQTGGSP